MKKSDLIPDIHWPENIIFGSRKYYLMNKKIDLINVKKEILNFYCINHHYFSIIIKKEKICNSKIQYVKKEKEFYLIENHSIEYIKNIIPKKKN